MPPLPIAPYSELHHVMPTDHAPPRKPSPSTHAEYSSPCKPTTPGDIDNGVKNAAGSAGCRKVLADLVCNDSPIVGLIPGLLNSATRTPLSNIKSGLGTQKRGRKPIALADESNLPAGHTPIGENLLRTQVQLLLQNVESENPAIRKAPSIRGLCHLQNSMDSPALKLLAPTPLNTPCNHVTVSANVAKFPSRSRTQGSSGVLNSVSKPATVEKSADFPEVCDSGHANCQAKLHQEQVASGNVVDNGIKLFVDMKISPTPEVVGPQCNGLQPNGSITQITITESVNSGRDIQIMQTMPLISEALYQADIPDLSLGKKTTRILQFESPDKSSSTDISCYSVPSPCENLSTVQERDEDEASEWSVLVNVSSPLTGRLAESELSTDNSEDTFQGSVDQHLQRKRLGSNKVELLWSVQRMGDGEERGGEYDDDGVQEELGPMDHCDAGECADEAWGGCDKLCESYFDMALDGEEKDPSSGLPGFEGKHIRFIYDSDSEEIIQEKTFFEGSGQAAQSVIEWGDPFQ